MNNLNVTELINEINKDYQIVQKIDKGFSYDFKYIIREKDHLKLLKVYDYKLKDDVLFKLEKMKEVYSLGVKCPKVYHYGENKRKGYCYSVVDYIEGEDGEEAITRLSVDKQYQIGYDAGCDLRIINSIEVHDKEDAYIKTLNEFDKLVKRYHELPVKIPYDKEIIDYVYKNMDIKKNRLLAFCHHDFHLRNIIIKDGKYRGVIDFNRCKWADPYHEFTKCEMFSTIISRAFSKGLINGYFKDTIPDDFWPFRAFDMARSIIGHIIWVSDIFPEELDNGLQTIDYILYNYDSFNRIVPRWYCE